MSDTSQTLRRHDASRFGVLAEPTEPWRHLHALAPHDSRRTTTKPAPMLVHPSYVHRRQWRRKPTVAPAFAMRNAA